MHSTRERLSQPNWLNFRKSKLCTGQKGSHARAEHNLT